jgi:very-short-patch-repair endonuclease
MYGEPTVKVRITSLQGLEFPRGTRGKPQKMILEWLCSKKTGDTLRGKKRRPLTPEERLKVSAIENEFDDKNVKKELVMSPFSIDFAWEHKKLAIEIDGDQHFTDPAQMERDKRKDALLASKGWQLLRIRWRDMTADTKHWIQIAKDFIGVAVSPSPDVE